MKKTFTILVLLAIVAVNTVFAQTPQLFKYQAVLRDASNIIVASTAKTVVIDILQGTATGTSVYGETHSITTTAQGVINLNIGGGSVNSGVFASIPWNTNTYWVKVTVDAVVISSAPLLSVPYALNAKYAETASYTNLTNKPSIPDAQVQTDWNASSGMGVLLNKPTLGTAAMANIGTSSGTIAVLDATGKIPNALLGLSGISYKGNYNLTSNPTVIVEISGNYYIISAAGTETGSGLTFAVGDWMISNGSAWQNISNSSAVTSVAGKTGAVTLSSGDMTDISLTGNATGKVLTWNGSAWAPASANLGSVTSVATGTGLTGGTITTTGSISLANTDVTPGSYTRATITVDAQGRITAAGNGAAVSLTSEVSGVLPLANGGTAASDAAGARSNLGLGTAALVNTGISSGNVPVLDGSNKIPNSLLNISGMAYKGSKSLSGNPTVTLTAEVSGNYYIISVAGTETGSGLTFAVGDWMISNGTAWQQISNSSAVSSVAGKTGAVTLAGADITSGTVAIANGGTGQSTATSAINALLPTQTSNSGKYLTTNGSAPSWGALTSSQWTTTGSDVYYNTGKVGIGTTAPSAKLSVLTTTEWGGMTVKGGTTADGATIGLSNSNGLGNYSLGVYGSANTGSIANNFYVYDNVASAVRMTVASTNGNVGIGTTTPLSKLQVYGTETGANWAGMGAFGGASSAVVLGQYNNKAYLGAHNAALSTWVDLLINPGGGNVGIGTATALTTLQLGQVGSIGQDANSIYFGSNFSSTGINFLKTGNYASQLQFDGALNSIIFKSTSSTGTVGSPITWVERMRIDANGKVGIGTTAPTAQLDVLSSNTYGISSTGSTTGSTGLYHIANSNAPTSWNLGVEGGAWAGGPLGSLYIDKEGVGPIVTFAPNGNVGIGTTNPIRGFHNGTTEMILGENQAGLADWKKWRIYLSGGAGSKQDITFGILNDLATSGQAYVTFSPTNTDAVIISGSVIATAYNTGSDRRLKNNIVNTHFGITDLMKIQVRDYEYKADASNTMVTGFIAQELYEIFPNAVSKPAKAEDMWAVDYGKVTPLLVKAIQDLNAKIELLEKENTTLKADNSSMKAKVESLDQLKAEVEAIKKSMNEAKMTGINK